MSEVALDWIDTRPADLDGYTSKILVSNGIPTRYYDVGDGPPLVMLHGAGWRGESSGNTYVPVFPYLSKHYRLIVPDKLASGLTGNPEGPEGYTIEAQVEHMTGFIKDLGLDRIFLVGQSRGGYLATRIAVENPGMIEALVIVDSGTVGPEVGDIAERRRKLFQGHGMEDKSMGKPDSLRDGLRTQHELLSFHTEHVTDEFLDAKMYMEGTDKSQQAVRDMNELGGAQIFMDSLRAQKKDTLERLRQGVLQAPVLVYWGADDPSAILEVGQELFQVIRQNNDRTRMLAVNHAGHFHYREHPREFSYNVHNFFEYWRAAGNTGD